MIIKSANLSATMGDLEGECDLVWNPVRGAASCVIQVADAGAGPWSAANNPTPTKSKAAVGGYAGGSRHWFRVAVLGTAGRDPWSDPHRDGRVMGKSSGFLIEIRRSAFIRSV